MKQNNLTAMNTKPKIPVGIDSFADLRLTSDVFVDKSMLIQEFLAESNDKLTMTLVARPGRWGKTLNIDMLKRFFAIEVDAQGKQIPPEKSLNRKLFVGGEVQLASGGTKLLEPLKISQDTASMQYQGQVPVISLCFKDLIGNSVKEIQALFFQKMRAICKEHAYMVDSKQLNDSQRITLEDNYLNPNKELSLWELSQSLRFLSELLHSHFGKKVYILIDDYDVPVISNHLKPHIKVSKEHPYPIQEIRQLILRTLIQSCRYSTSTDRGFLTGVFKITYTPLGDTELNQRYVREYTLLDQRFMTAYGFREQEVDELLAKVPIAIDRAELRQWYSGYTFEEENFYNPFSIMSCLANDGKLRPYWEESGGTRLVSSSLFSEDIPSRTYSSQKNLQSLVAGKTVVMSVTGQFGFQDFHTNKSLDSLLFFGGYLQRPVVLQGIGIWNRYTLAIPNHEARQMYERRLLWWVSDQLQLSATSYQNLVKLLAERQLEAFEQRLGELLQGARDFMQDSQEGLHPIWGKEGELLYSGLLLSLIRSLSPYYLIEVNQDSLLSLPEMVLIPQVAHGDQAMVIEHEVCQDALDLPSRAEQGLVQLAKKDYATRAKAHAHVKKLLQIFLAFSGKQVAMKYKEATL